MTCDLDLLTSGGRRHKERGEDPDDGGLEVHEGDREHEALLGLLAIELRAADLGDDHEGADGGEEAGRPLEDEQGDLIRIGAGGGHGLDPKFRILIPGGSKVARYGTYNRAREMATTGHA